ncbi:MAG: hypothetical protein QOC63_2273 [Mycobacterium sp.]|jgi:hypothetical protein|nr:hypothetical protein [Mycobacterium sp.]
MTCAFSAMVTDSIMAVNPFRFVLAAAAVVMLAAGIAHADGPDDQFLAMLSKDGIVGAPDQMIALAHERCDDGNLSRSGSFTLFSGKGPSPYMFAIGNIYTELEATGMNSAQAAQFIRDAITVYCPDQKGS